MAVLRLKSRAAGSRRAQRTEIRSGPRFDSALTDFPRAHIGAGRCSSSSAKRGQLVIEAPAAARMVRGIRYAFSVPTSPFVSQVNRATNETMRVQATQEGLLPLKSWIKSALDQVAQVSMGEPGLEFVSCWRRRHRPAPTGPDTQHPRLGGDQDAQGPRADCSLPEPCKSRAALAPPNKTRTFS